MIRRTPLARGTKPMNRGAPMNRGGRVKPFSKKRTGERDARQQVIAEAMRRDGGCVAVALVPEITCWGRLDCDEIIPRGVRPGAHLEIDNVQMICRAHHDWKHAYPREAQARGLRKWSHEDAR